MSNSHVLFQDGAGRPFPGAAGTVSTPPTPFADRESLEAELLAIEREIGQYCMCSSDRLHSQIFRFCVFFAQSLANSYFYMYETQRVLNDL
jgi:hypothetical protein